MSFMSSSLYDGNWLAGNGRIEYRGPSRINPMYSLFAIAASVLQMAQGY
jgi:hypothetical protein